MTEKKIYLFIGTTAELIKLVPVIRELIKRKVSFTIIASGQNDIKFDEFKYLIGKRTIIYAVTPKSKKSSVFKFSIWSLRTFFSLLLGMRSNFKGLNKSNSIFIVHGDTVSSLMGSLVATLYGLKLVHIESGLRSFRFFEPFPEEICRYIISRFADIHFCPNKWSVNNLRSVEGEKISTEQNTLIEIFWYALKSKYKASPVMKLARDNSKYFVLVSHRQEHVIFNKQKTREILEFLLKNAPPNLLCVFVVHDLSAAFIHTFKMKIGKILTNKIIFTNRLSYIDYMHLVKGSEFMITDGGSNQEELYYMGKPCLLLRRYTERIEGLNWNVVLSKNDTEVILNFLYNYKRYIHSAVRPFHRPSKIIVDRLLMKD